ncbi:beta-alanine transporter-like [Paramacrobiotus metropolitanus]|uniref:beta-alanine transporter-like n=1 Tax=Paramacrobiotus metropolitanus TaxID=2943436 RepID=UPI002445F939|nr:beta-alanine transporter-like [Paramacrobiotus metropolitanus]
MDFDDILEKVGSFGKYQKLILYLVLFPATLPCGFFAFNQLLMSGMPRNYWCRLPVENLTQEEIFRLLPNSTDPDSRTPNDKCQMYNVNYTDPTLLLQLPGILSNATTIPCTNGWEYDRTDWESTIVTEWDLVCDKELYVTYAYTINGAGGLLAMFLLGYVADHYGRKISYFLTFGMMMLASIATPFSPNYAWFCVFRFIVGGGIGWSFTIPMMIAMELIGPAPRALMSVIVSVYYTLSILLIGGVSYFLPSWKPFALVSSLPLIIFIGFYWVMPESPRWLLSQRRYDEVAQFFRKIARVNKRPLEPGFDKRLPEILRRIDEDARAADERGDRRYTTWDLFRTPNMCKKTLILIFANTTNLGVYIGLTLYGPSINENPHWNYFLSGLAEMPGYLFTTIMADRLGRRFTLVVCMVFSGAVGIAAAGVPVTSTGILMGLVFACKFSISIAFVLSELLEDELFPTVVRGEGHSVTAFTSNFFTLGVPFMVFLGYQYMVLPLILFGAICLIAAFFCLFLPETVNMDLPQTLEDGELMGKNMRWAEVFSFKIPSKRRNMAALEAEETNPLQIPKTGLNVRTSMVLDVDLAEGKVMVHGRRLDSDDIPDVIADIKV